MRRENEYRDMTDAFAQAIVDARCEKEFMKQLRGMVDRMARDISCVSDEHITDMIKGKIAICYEFADGIAQALNAREEQANSERAEGYPDAP